MEAKLGQRGSLDKGRPLRIAQAEGHVGGKDENSQALRGSGVWKCSGEPHICLCGLGSVCLREIG